MKNSPGSTARSTPKTGRIPADRQLRGRRQQALRSSRESRKIDEHATLGVDLRDQAIGRMQIVGEGLAQVRAELTGTDAALETAPFSCQGGQHRCMVASRCRGCHPRFVVVDLTGREYLSALARNG